MERDGLHRSLYDVYYEVYGAQFSLFGGLGTGGDWNEYFAARPLSTTELTYRNLRMRYYDRDFLNRLTIAEGLITRELPALVGQEVVTEVAVDRASAGLAGILGIIFRSFRRRAARCVIEPGKFKYLFGEVASNSHSAERSLQNLVQFRRIGIHNDDAGRQLLSDHFQRVVADPSNVVRTVTEKLPNGRVITKEIRESLLSGPGGFLKIDSAFEIMKDGSRRLITAIPIGGRG